MPRQASSNQVYGYTILVLSALVWGTEAILAKLCYAGGFTVASLLSLRYLVALPVFAVLARRDKEPLVPPRHILKPLALLSVNMLCGTVTLYLTISLLPATLAILFFYAYPSFTSLFHLLLRRGSLGAARVLALLLSALGLILLYWSSAAGISVLGVAVALLSAILQATKLIQTGDLLPHINAYRLTFFTAAFTTLATTLFYICRSLISGSWGLGAITHTGWIYLILIGLGVTVFGNLLMTIGINYVGAVDTSLVLLLEPLVTALLAFMIFGDTLSTWQLLGGSLILVAVALPAVANLRRREPPQKEGLSDEAG